MSPYPISNAHTSLNHINGSIVNMDGSGVGGIPFSNTRIPNGPHTLGPAGSNVQSAAGIYKGGKGGKGGKINRKKINKISRKYKMKGSKKTIKKNVRRMKSRVRSRYSRKATTRSSRRASSRRRALMSVGGAFQSPMTTPNYPAGHSQYLNNNGSLSNTYSLGGPLSVGNSALATPPPYQQVVNASIPDNLNHNTLNSSGNIGAGSGFPSRGWF
jgi:hypothetical protein